MAIVLHRVPFHSLGQAMVQYIHRAVIVVTTLQLNPVWNKENKFINKKKHSIETLIYFLENIRKKMFIICFYIVPRSVGDKLGRATGFITISYNYEMNILWDPSLYPRATALYYRPSENTWERCGKYSVYMFCSRAATTAVGTDCPFQRPLEKPCTNLSICTLSFWKSYSCFPSCPFSSSCKSYSLQWLPIRISEFWSSCVQEYFYLYYYLT